MVNPSARQSCARREGRLSKLCKGALSLPFFPVALSYDLVLKDS